MSPNNMFKRNQPATPMSGELDNVETDITVDRVHDLKFEIQWEGLNMKKLKKISQGMSAEEILEAIDQHKKDELYLIKVKYADGGSDDINKHKIKETLDLDSKINKLTQELLQAPNQESKSNKEQGAILSGIKNMTNALISFPNKISSYFSKKEDENVPLPLPEDEKIETQGPTQLSLDLGSEFSSVDTPTQIQPDEEISAINSVPNPDQMELSLGIDGNDNMSTVELQRFMANKAENIDSASVYSEYNSMLDDSELATASHIIDTDEIINSFQQTDFSDLDNSSLQTNLPPQTSGEINTNEQTSFPLMEDVSEIIDARNEGVDSLANMAPAEKRKMFAGASKLLAKMDLRKVDWKQVGENAKNNKGLLVATGVAGGATLFVSAPLIMSALGASGVLAGVASNGAAIVGTQVVAAKFGAAALGTYSSLGLGALSNAGTIAGIGTAVSGSITAAFGATALGKLFKKPSVYEAEKGQLNQSLKKIGDSIKKEIKLFVPDRTLKKDKIDTLVSNELNSLYAHLLTTNQINAGDPVPDLFIAPNGVEYHIDNYCHAIIEKNRQALESGVYNEPEPVAAPEPSSVLSSDLPTVTDLPNLAEEELELPEQLRIEENKFHATKLVNIIKTRDLNQSPNLNEDIFWVLGGAMSEIKQDFVERELEGDDLYSEIQKLLPNGFDFTSIGDPNVRKDWGDDGIIPFAEAARVALEKYSGVSLVDEPSQSSAELPSSQFVPNSSNSFGDNIDITPSEIASYNDTIEQAERNLLIKNEATSLIIVCDSLKTNLDVIEYFKINKSAILQNLADKDGNIIGPTLFDEINKDMPRGYSFEDFYIHDLNDYAIITLVESTMKTLHRLADKEFKYQDKDLDIQNQEKQDFNFVHIQVYQRATELVKSLNLNDQTDTVVEKEIAKALNFIKSADTQNILSASHDDKTLLSWKIIPLSGDQAEEMKIINDQNLSFEVFSIDGVETKKVSIDTYLTITAYKIYNEIQKTNLEQARLEQIELARVEYLKNTANHLLNGITANYEESGVSIYEYTFMLLGSNMGEINDHYKQNYSNGEDLFDLIQVKLGKDFYFQDINDKNIRENKNIYTDNDIDKFGKASLEVLSELSGQPIPQENTPSAPTVLSTLDTTTGDLAAEGADPEIDTPVSQYTYGQNVKSPELASEIDAPEAIITQQANLVESQNIESIDQSELEKEKELNTKFGEISRTILTGLKNRNLNVFKTQEDYIIDKLKVLMFEISPKSRQGDKDTLTKLLTEIQKSPEIEFDFISENSTINFINLWSSQRNALAISIIKVLERLAQNEPRIAESTTKDNANLASQITTEQQTIPSSKNNEVENGSISPELSNTLEKLINSTPLADSSSLEIDEIVNPTTADISSDIELGNTEPDFSNTNTVHSPSKQPDALVPTSVGELTIIPEFVFDIDDQANLEDRSKYFEKSAKVMLLAIQDKSPRNILKYLGSVYENIIQSPIINMALQKSLLQEIQADLIDNSIFRDDKYIINSTLGSKSTQPYIDDLAKVTIAVLKKYANLEKVDQPSPSFTEKIIYEVSPSDSQNLAEAVKADIVDSPQNSAVVENQPVPRNEKSPKFDTSSYSNASKKLISEVFTNVKKRKSISSELSIFTKENLGYTINLFKNNAGRELTQSNIEAINQSSSINRNLANVNDFKDFLNEIFRSLSQLSENTEKEDRRNTKYVQNTVPLLCLARMSVPIGSEILNFCESYPTVSRDESLNEPYFDKDRISTISEDKIIEYQKAFMKALATF
jgi:hypothetical protein